MPRLPSVWWFAFGYFACYAPYSALTKAVSKGLLPNQTEPLSGFELLPVTVCASLVGMLTFITVMGWWKYATQHEIAGRVVPGPSRPTLVSGLCTAVIIGTTTLAYTFSGVSIVFMMLLMRGGVLAIAPIVDRISGRDVRWFSWVALALSMSALVVAFAEDGGYELTIVAAVDVTAYLGAYFARLRLMSRSAKSDSLANVRYFVEEQMVATPAVLTFLALGAIVGQGEVLEALRRGFLELPLQSELLLPALLIGLLSQGTGVFGGLILLGRQENSFCVPVNRASSILAGVVASVGLWAILDQSMPSASQLVGAALIIAAILFLSLPPLLQARRTR